MMKMKIIFLDIEGVLKRVQDKGINPTLIANVKELVEKTGAKIVISSDWRYNGLDFVKNYLIEVQEHIIDVTPALEVKKKFSDNFELFVPVPRGLEIKEWIEKNTTMEQYINNYVIIDDSQDMLYTQKNNYVNVLQHVGFDKKCLEKALEILKV
jgi:cytochrome oxidase Cu insertion factor (SCO1/SenC/PrrC family)